MNQDKVNIFCDELQSCTTNKWLM